MALLSLEETEYSGWTGAEHVAIRPNGAIFRQIRTLFNVGVIGDLTDAQLLERFTTLDREAAELAFAALVERHGPMVLRVCRNLLQNPHDAEDAFQATFLILVQKARCLWVTRLPGSLATSGGSSRRFASQGVRRSGGVNTSAARPS